MNSIHLPNDSKSRKTMGHCYFNEYLVSVVSLTFPPKTLICNKITSPALNSLSLAELAVSVLIKRIFKKNTIISFSIRFITT